MIWLVQLFALVFDIAHLIAFDGFCVEFVANSISEQFLLETAVDLKVYFFLHLINVYKLVFELLVFDKFVEDTDTDIHTDDTDIDIQFL